MFKPLDTTRGLSDRLRDLYFHWQRAHHRGTPPSLDRFGLHRVAAGLDCVVVTEILRSAEGIPEDFAFLYIGRTVNGVLRQELTGHRMSENPEKRPGSQIWAAYMAIAQDPRPLLVSLPYIGPDPRYSCTQEVFLPVHDDAGRHRFIVAGIELCPVGHPACPDQPAPRATA
ncbi:hypothetical protein [Maliponia aquimaris]|uniref:PAS domain protein n=1 Tax=Maliponia aquimaris TaxID=1673631 RepID=A0A238JSQ3_9RHOB|nr:hypothetical protein [Maliponia aquimaris]SMX33503.1 hypothetical protein MAA8898_00478 [Maliponia aquimaris]